MPYDRCTLDVGNLLEYLDVHLDREVGATYREHRSYQYTRQIGDSNIHDMATLDHHRHYHCRLGLSLILAF